MRRLILTLAILLPAPALADKIDQIQTPSGITVDYVKCSRNANRCMNAVADYCEGSYQVIDSESHMGTFVTDVIAGQVTWYSMTFLCGKSDGILPEFPFRGPQATKPSVLIPPQVRAICTMIGRSQSCRSQ